MLKLEHIHSQTISQSDNSETNQNPDSFTSNLQRILTYQAYLGIKNYQNI